MKFYDRVNELIELETLSKAADKKAVMCIITGVRRVGKTELIKQFFKQEEGIYFFVNSTKTSSQLLAEFSSELKIRLKLPERLAINTWDDFFSDLFQEAKKRKLIVAFDEFQRFVWIDKNLPFVLQKYFDLNKNESKLLILISGSSFGLLKQMFVEHDAPLFQRATNIIHLKPFSFENVYHILDDFGIKNFEDKIELYALFGGIPRYYDLLEDYSIKNADDAVRKLIFAEHAPLKEEIKNIITEEFGKETITYYSIISAVALGKNKANEIADYAEMKETSLSHYLYDLIEILGAIKKEISITEDIKSKKGRYYLNNNFFKFWFKFVYRNASDFELGRFEELYNKFKNEKDSFVSFAFEEICKQYLLKKMKIDKIGRWWGKEKNKSIEIDLVGLDQKKNLAIFAECKWQKKQPTIADLEELKRKANFVEWNRNNRLEKFVFFSKSGFDKKTREYGKANGWLLVDLEELEKVLSSRESKK